MVAGVVALGAAGCVALLGDYTTGASGSGDGGPGADGTAPESGGPDPVTDDASSDAGKDSGLDAPDGMPPTVALIGEVDRNFVNGAKASALLDYSTALTIDAQGLIYVVGRADGCIGAANNRSFGISRFAANGDLDVAWGTGGRFCVAFAAAPSDFPNAVAIDPDGNLVVVGSSYDPSLARNRAAITRVLTAGAGALDPNFNGGATPGKIVIPMLGVQEAFAVAFDANKNIIVVGRDDTNNPTKGFILRLTPQGVPDTSFDGDGIVIDNTVAHGFDGVSVGQGAIFAAGANGLASSATRDAVVAKYTAIGSPAAAFGSSGHATFGLSAAHLDEARRIVLTPTGIFVAGAGKIPSGGGDGVASIAHLLNTGSLDLGGFNNSGVPGPAGVFASDTVKWSTSQVGSIVPTAGGKLIVAGGVDNAGANKLRDMALTRVDANTGKVDTTFGTAGVVVSDVDNVDYMVDMAVDPKGRIVTLGHNNFQTTVLVRFH
ncbi:MAG: uncharacterized protein JWP87_2746 [Labilithrix sp.]|nr:uncharacterized protein [Labilithrix sp.]